MLNKGFTLLEVLIVVLIIALLASIAIPKYKDTLEQSRGAEAYANLRALRASALRFAQEVDNGITTAPTTETTAKENMAVLDVEDKSNNDWTYVFDWTDSSNWTVEAKRENSEAKIVLKPDGTLDDTEWRKSSYFEQSKK